MAYNKMSKTKQEKFIKEQINWIKKKPGADSPDEILEKGLTLHRAWVNLKKNFDSKEVHLGKKSTYSSPEMANTSAL